jgi:hypothetical protein
LENAHAHVLLYLVSMKTISGLFLFLALLRVKEPGLLEGFAFVD